MAFTLSIKSDLGGKLSTTIDCWSKYRVQSIKVKYFWQKRRKIFDKITGYDLRCWTEEMWLSLTEVKICANFNRNSTDKNGLNIDVKFWLAPQNKGFMKSVLSPWQMNRLHILPVRIHILNNFERFCHSKIWEICFNKLSLNIFVQIIKRLQDVRIVYHGHLGNLSLFAAKIYVGVGKTDMFWIADFIVSYTGFPSSPTFSVQIFWSLVR